MGNVSLAGDIYREYPKCPCCGRQVVIDAPMRVWTEMDGLHYHNLCLKGALADAAQYRMVYSSLVHPQSHMPISSGAFTDVWTCRHCGGRTGGYLAMQCLHCGAAGNDWKGGCEQATC